MINTIKCEKIEIIGFMYLKKEEFVFVKKCLRHTMKNFKLQTL